VDDAVYDGKVAYTIVTAKAVSSDPNYNGLNPADVSVSNLDNDAPNLAWATYVGGGGGDSIGSPVDGNSVAVDASGNILVAGWTTSAPPRDQSSLFVRKATDSYHGGCDAFVAKLSSNGSLLWVTYVGGSGGDYAQGIAVDSTGNAFVTGWTSSTDFAGANNQIHGVPIQNPNGT
jgi:hypothetical protein